MNTRSWVLVASGCAVVLTLAAVAVYVFVIRQPVPDDGDRFSVGEVREAFSRSGLPLKVIPPGESHTTSEKALLAPVRGDLDRFGVYVGDGGGTLGLFDYVEYDCKGQLCWRQLQGLDRSWTFLYRHGNVFLSDGENRTPTLTREQSRLVRIVRDLD